MLAARRNDGDIDRIRRPAIGSDRIEGDVIGFIEESEYTDKRWDGDIGEENIKKQQNDIGR